MTSWSERVFVLLGRQFQPNSCPVLSRCHKAEPGTQALLLNSKPGRESAQVGANCLHQLGDQSRVRCPWSRRANSIWRRVRRSTIGSRPIIVSRSTHRSRPCQRRSSTWRVVGTGLGLGTPRLRLASQDAAVSSAFSHMLGRPCRPLAAWSCASVQRPCLRNHSARSARAEFAHRGRP